MAAEVVNVDAGIVTVRIDGILNQTALAGLQMSLADIIRTHGKVRILVLAEQFAGWERGGDWNDFSFQDQFDPCIEKMAIVGDQRWEDLALVFTAKGLRPFPIEYFTPSESDSARAWLGVNP